ncbi:MAG: hypothetical protein KGJ13_01850 [Patescibacteria group bacterium]|nr:hypothetical protein [Patescibacteria group bacterium]
MSKTSWAILIILIVVVVLIGVIYWTMNNGGSYTPGPTTYAPTSTYAAAGSSTGAPASTSTIPPSAASSNTGTSMTAGQSFASSSYAQYAYLISGPMPYNAATQNALSGMKVQRKMLAGGAVQFTLLAQNPNYKTQIYTVQPGQKLYYIERNSTDDIGTADNFPNDDSAVVVDASGILVNQ